MLRQWQHPTVQAGHLLKARSAQDAGGQRRTLARATERDHRLALRHLGHAVGQAADGDLHHRIQLRRQRLVLPLARLAHIQQGDRIAVLKDGILQQVGTPRDLYERPNNVFVAGFIGSPAMNLFPAPLAEGGVQFGSEVVPLDRDTVGRAHGSEVTIGVRPEDIVVGPADGKGLPVTVDLVEELGADGYLYGHTDINGKRTDIVARVDGRNHPHSGETVTLAATAGHVHAFDIETGERLNDAPVLSE